MSFYAKENSSRKCSNILKVSYGFLQQLIRFLQRSILSLHAYYSVFFRGRKYKNEQVTETDQGIKQKALLILTRQDFSSYKHFNPGVGNTFDLQPKPVPGSTPW